MHQRTYDRLLERLWDCEERRDIDVAGSSNGWWFGTQAFGTTRYFEVEARLALRRDTAALRFRAAGLAIGVTW